MGEPRLTDEQKEQMFALFDKTNEATGKAYTLDEIAEQIDASKETVGRYRRQRDSQQERKEELVATVVQADGREVFEKLLRSSPGLTTEKIQYALSIVDADQTVLRNPNELWRILVEGLRLQQFPAERILKATLAASNPPGQPPGIITPQGGQGYGPVVAGQQGWNPQQPMVMQTPYGPMVPMQYAFPQQQQPKGLTAEDVAAIVEKTLERVLPQQQAGPATVRRTRRPILDDRTGDVLRDAAGNPVYITEEEGPVEQGGPKGNMWDDLAKAKDIFHDDQLGRVADAMKAQAEAMPETMERLAAKLIPAGGGDVETRVALAKMEAQFQKEAELNKERQKLTEERMALRDQHSGVPGLQRPPEDIMLESIGRQGLQYYDKHLRARDMTMDRAVAVLEHISGMPKRRPGAPRLSEEELLETERALDQAEALDPSPVIVGQAATQVMLLPPQAEPGVPIIVHPDEPGDVGVRVDADAPAEPVEVAQGGNGAAEAAKPRRGRPRGSGKGKGARKKPTPTTLPEGDAVPPDAEPTPVDVEPAPSGGA